MDNTRKIELQKDIINRLKEQNATIREENRKLSLKINNMKEEIQEYRKLKQQYEKSLSELSILSEQCIRIRNDYKNEKKKYKQKMNRYLGQK